MRLTSSLLALALLATLPQIAYAQVPESDSDATSYMDKKVGNQLPPQDNTLSNEEVIQLEHENVPVRHGAATDDNPNVSGSTSIYKEKGGSAAKSEGQQLPADAQTSGTNEK